jgi:excisionase family DNA binding protein
MERKNFLTTGEAARWCGVSLVTVLRWIRSGRLQAYRLPGRGDHRISRQHFNGFLAEHGLPLPDQAGRRKRILVVDDDRAALKRILRTLEELGYEIKVAPDGFAAGTQLFAFSPDLITLNLKMPGLGGQQVIEFVRSSPQLKHTKTLVVTGASPSELKRAVALGADAAIQKPVDSTALKNEVRALLEEKARVRARLPRRPAGPARKASGRGF